MPEPECSGSEHIADAGMNVWIVAIECGHIGAEQRWQIFIHYDVLQGSNDDSSGALKDVLVAPGRMLTLNSSR